MGETLERAALHDELAQLYKSREVIEQRLAAIQRNRATEAKLRERLARIDEAIRRGEEEVKRVQLRQREE